ncbi:hypothetical protein SNEBB_009360 [Seison nebaliae]|nr:hypothetical protein SNEBB_009360 [Seison nebaliae]
MKRAQIAHKQKKRVEDSQSNGSSASMGLGLFQIKDKAPSDDIILPVNLRVDYETSTKKIKSGPSNNKDPSVSGKIPPSTISLEAEDEKSKSEDNKAKFQVVQILDLNRHSLQNIKIVSEIFDSQKFHVWGIDSGSGNVPVEIPGNTELAQYLPMQSVTEPKNSFFSWFYVDNNKLLETTNNMKVQTIMLTDFDGNCSNYSNLLNCHVRRQFINQMTRKTRSNNPEFKVFHVTSRRTLYHERNKEMKSTWQDLFSPIFLPLSCLMHFALYMGPKELTRLKLVCKSFYKDIQYLENYSSIWLNFCYRDIGNDMVAAVSGCPSFAKISPTQKTDQTRREKIKVKHIIQREQMLNERGHFTEMKEKSSEMIIPQSEKSPNDFDSDSLIFTRKYYYMIESESEYAYQVLNDRKYWKKFYKDWLKRCTLPINGQFNLVFSLDLGKEVIKCMSITNHVLATFHQLGQLRIWVRYPGQSDWNVVASTSYSGTTYIRLQLIGQFSNYIKNFGGRFYEKQIIGITANIEHLRNIRVKLQKDHASKTNNKLIKYYDRWMKRIKEDIEENMKEAVEYQWQYQLDRGTGIAEFAKNRGLLIGQTKVVTNKHRDDFCVANPFRRLDSSISIYDKNSQKFQEPIVSKSELHIWRPLLKWKGGGEYKIGKRERVILPPDCSVVSFECNCDHLVISLFDIIRDIYLLLLITFDVDSEERLLRPIGLYLAPEYVLLVRNNFFFTLNPELNQIDCYSADKQIPNRFSCIDRTKNNYKQQLIKQKLNNSPIIEVILHFLKKTYIDESWNVVSSKHVFQKILLLIDPIICRIDYDHAKSDSLQQIEIASGLYGTSELLSLPFSLTKIYLERSRVSKNYIVGKNQSVICNGRFGPFLTLGSAHLTSYEQFAWKKPEIETNNKYGNTVNGVFSTQRKTVIQKDYKRIYKKKDYVTMDNFKESQIDKMLNKLFQLRIRL